MKDNKKVEKKIEAIKMKGEGSSNIPGLGDFEVGTIRLVPEEVSIRSARTLVERGSASSVKRPEPVKEEAALKDETSKTSEERG